MRRISLPTTRLAIPTYYVIATAEASSNLARFDGVRYGLRVEPPGSGESALVDMLSATREEGFGDEVKRRILLGTFVLSRGYAEAWYGQALRAREALRAEFRAAFAEVDLVAGPTSPSAAFRLGQHAHDPLALYLTDVLTVPANLAGLPAAPGAIAPESGVGHVNLRVADMGRALRFYRDVIGLTVTQRDEESVFLAAGSYHHHLALNVWGGPVAEPPDDAAGLHHFALRLPGRRALAEAVARIVRSGHELLGATDHGVNLAVYLRDPDGNGLELMVDRPPSEWPQPPR